MSDLTRRLANDREHSNNALAAYAEEAMAKYKAQGGDSDDVRGAADNVLNGAKKCGEVWNEAERRHAVVKAAVNLIADGFGYEAAGPYGKVLVTSSSYSDLLDAVIKFIQGSTKGEANNAE